MSDFVYKPAFESQFKKHYKKMLKGSKYQAKDFERVYRKLLCNKPLEARYNDYPLINRRPERDLHIKPDWLLIYKYDGEYVDFINTGSRSDLFK